LTPTRFGRSGSWLDGDGGAKRIAREMSIARPARRRCREAQLATWRACARRGAATSERSTSPSAMRHAVAHSVHVDEAVGGDATSDASLACRQNARWQRAQCLLLVAPEATGGHLVHRAVDALVGLAHPLPRVRLQRSERLERAASDGVSLHVLAPGLGLALGARSIRPAGAWHDAPVAAELRERRMERHRLRRRLGATVRWVLRFPLAEDGGALTSPRTRSTNRRGVSPTMRLKSRAK
jgi:hypothetical protein